MASKYIENLNLLSSNISEPFKTEVNTNAQELCFNGLVLLNVLTSEACREETRTDRNLFFEE